ncbi:MAG: tRNA lysidine(34) synthetase TilS [bacterium]|nr:tRNA lysidine(34) synthetase TilS [bacterium]
MPGIKPNSDGLLRQVESGLAQAGVMPGEGLVVAVSGGVDSVVLLDVLHRLSGNLGLWLHVAHLDHQLRPDSAADAIFVQTLAVSLGWAATIESVNVTIFAKEHGMSTEQAGRACRRDMWNRVASRVGCRWIAVGHHADDQAETVLLRLLRGAGATGLGAMRPAVDGIVRPMLAARRSSVAAYAEQRGLEVREDPTNRDVRIPRNRIRHELLPHLAQRHNPAIVEGLVRTARLLQADDDYLEGASQSAAQVLLKQRRGACIRLDTAALRGYHIAIQRRVLRQYIQELAQDSTGASQQVTFASVEGVVEYLAAEGAGLHQVLADIWVQNTGTDLVMRRGPASVVHAEIVIPGRTPVPAQSMALEATVVSPVAFTELKPALGKYRVAFDERAAHGRLQLRSPRPGDRLRPLGMGGHHKKLSDCFIDARWPRILRQDALVLVRSISGADEEVLWVVGLIRSEAFPVASDTDCILYLEIVDTNSPEPGVMAPQLTD